jgi:type VI secretion system protein ImpL
MSTAWLPRAQTLANIAGAALLVWLAAPLLSLDGHHPFDGRPERAALLAFIATVLGLALLLRRWLRQRRNAQLFARLQAGDDAEQALAQRFASAMQMLRAGLAARGGAPAHWWQRRRQVYQLPWYLFIGAPGAGKTTALLNAGLRFPLAERLGAAPVAGVGGTRQCDWWFTDQAVFIDTAGRYTTQDSRGDQDASEWRLFLQLLRRYRAVQPINGVIVTVSAPDLLAGGAELAHQAAAIDRRLQELRTQLGQSFPVYLLVTKVDLLAGFIENFGDFDPAQRQQPWGIAFEWSGNAAALPDDLGARLADLPARLAAAVPQRLQAEPLPERRPAIYLFPAQVEALLPALEQFTRRAFRHAADAPAQPLRGIHFSSGTQEGNPIDRVIGDLGRSYGFAPRAREAAPGQGKAFFLAGWLMNLVIAEAPLAGFSLVRRRRQRRLETALGAAAALAMLLACAGWVHSYRSNRDYVAAVRERVARVAEQVGPARDGRIDRLLPLYALLDQLAASGGIDPDAAPPGLGLGLFQGPRLARSAEQTYHRVLDRTFAPLVVDRLAAAVRQERDPATRYEALRVALMLVTPERLQRGEVRRWAEHAYTAPGSAAVAPGAGEQQDWLRHFDALLERNAVLEAMRLDDATLQSTRAALAAVPLEQRVHDRLLRRARERFGAAAPAVPELSSPAAVLAFAPADAASAPVSMAASFTRQGWREMIEPAVEPTIAEVADEAGWVLGDRSPALQRLAAEREARAAVAQAVGLRHAQAAIAAWDRLLAGLALQPPADADALARFAAELAAPESPLRLLLRRLAAEFALPAAGPASLSAAAGQSPSPSAAGPAPSSTSSTSAGPAAGSRGAEVGASSPIAGPTVMFAAAGLPSSSSTAARSAPSPADAAYTAAMAAHFAGLRDYAAAAGVPGTGALDRLLPPLAAALQDPAGARAAELLRQLRAESAAAPAPLRAMWHSLAEALAGAQRRAQERQLGSSLADLAQACRRLTADRFPFAPAAKRDLPYADFARLFGPQGLFDSVFRQQLAARVDSSRRPWRLRDEAVPPLAQVQAQAALRSFEMAEDIRRLFFPAGRSLPQLRLQMTPAAMDAELLLFSLDVDGQLLRYENGPRRPKPLLWPGPAATQKVVLRILPAGPSGIGAEVHEGPWALLRVLQREGALSPGAARTASARVAVDGRALQLDVQAEAPGSVALLGELGRFRCPEAW